MTVRNAHILVVDDNPDDVELLRIELDKLGLDLELQAIQDKEKLTEILEGSPPDLIISDYNLSGFDGMEVLRLTRKLHPDLPFILISGYIGEEKAVDAMKEGASDYVMKDRLERLGPAIQRELKAYEEQRKAGRELLEAEEKLREVVENSTNLFYRHTPDHVLTYVSPQSREFLGCGPEEAMRKWTEFVTDNPVNEEGFGRTQRAIDTGEAQPPFKLELRKETGEIIWVEVNEVPVVRGGETVAIVGSLTDITERKQYEEQLQESLERYEYVSRASRDAIYDWDILNDHLSLGEGFGRLFGHRQEGEHYPLEKWIGHVHPDDHPKTMESLERALENPGVNRWSAAYRFERADGSYAHVDENGFIVRNEEGEAIRMVGAVRDVSDKMELEKLLDQVQRMARFGVWEVDLEKKSMYWSPVTREIHEVEPGFEPDIETGIHFYKEGDSRDKIRSAIEAAIEQGASWDLELKIVTARGRERWIRAKGEAEFREGRCVRLFGSFQDIHSRKEAEIELSRAYAKNERILNRIGDGFFAVDKDWTITYWNKRAEELIGVGKEQLIGKNLWEAFPEAKEVKFFSEYERAMREQIAVHFEGYYAPLNQWLEVHAYPSEEGLSVFFRDVTEKKMAEQEIREANRMLKQRAEELSAINVELEQFAYVASHDLQEPLRMVTSFLTQLEKKYGDLLDEKALEYIGFAVNGAHQMRRIILDLLDYSRVGQTDRKIQKIDLDRLLKEVVKLERSGIEELDADIRWNGLPQIEGIEVSMRQLFQNLISNALRYHKPGVPPVVEIEGTETETHWQFSVSDNGIGMNPEYSEVIFTIFKRLHTRDAYPGTGVGLALCKKIVEQHGGEIGVESEEGEGSRFHFTIRKQRS